MVLPKSGRVGRRRVFIKAHPSKRWAFFLPRLRFQEPPASENQGLVFRFCFLRLWCYFVPSTVVSCFMVWNSLVLINVFLTYVIFFTGHY